MASVERRGAAQSALSRGVPQRPAAGAREGPRNSGDDAARRVNARSPRRTERSMKPFLAISLCALSLPSFMFAARGQDSEASSLPATPGTVQMSGSFEAQVAEYLRQFPYQLTYDYTVRFTGGDPKNFNRWVPAGEPALARAGDDVLPRTNN